MTPGTIAYQAHLSMGFPRQQYWSGLPCPSPGDLSNPGIELMSPVWQVDPFNTAIREAQMLCFNWSILK